MSEQNLDELLKLGFQYVGDFISKGDRLTLFLNKHEKDTGSYAFVIDNKVKYVGVTKNSLYARMYGYTKPGPSQETNKRINPELAKARKVPIYFLPESEITKFVTVIRRSKFERQIPTDLDIFERFLISTFKPKWNRY